MDCCDVIDKNVPAKCCFQGLVCVRIRPLKHDMCLKLKLVSLPDDWYLNQKWDVKAHSGKLRKAR